MKKEDVLEGARQLASFAGIRKGDNVLIFVDFPNDDPLVVNSLVTASEEKGGVAVVVKAREWPMRFGRAPRIIEKALCGADVVIDQGGSLDPKGPDMLVAMKEYGATYIINNVQTAESMGSDFARFPWICSSKSERRSTIRSREQSG